MASDLSWNLTGNDQLSGVLEKLDRTLGKLSRHIDDTTADAKAMGNALGSTAQSASRADRAMEHLSNVTDRVRGRIDAARQMMMQFGLAATIALGAAGVAVGKLALETAAANETAAISFEVLLGSAQKAATFMEQLKKFAAETPFELPELRSAASRLLAVGVETKKIIPLLTRLGDATAAMGTGAFGIDRAVYALQQMSQAGKVSLEDINQLTDAGIPALDALSAKLGTTVAKLREDISAGKIKPEQLFDAILSGAGKTFPKLNGMMTRQSQTLSGLWSAFKDNASQSLATFAEPAIPGLKKVLDWTATNLPKGLGWLLEQGAKVKEWFDKNPIKGQWAAALQKLGDQVLPTLKDAWKDLTTWIKENEDKFEKISRFVTEYVIPIFSGALVDSIYGVVDAIKFGVTATEWLISAFSFMTRHLLTYMSNVLGAAVRTFGWIPGLGPKLKKAERDFNIFATHVLDSLNRIDGKTVNVTVKGNIKVQGGTQLKGDEGEYRRASGGPVWQGESYRVNELGVEQFYAAQTGWIANRQTSVAMASRGGGGGDVIGYLEVVHKTPDGETLRTELLALKRRRGLATLGF